MKRLQTVKRDPHGDTILAQINPQEAELLKALGGAGVRDAKGRTHFYPAGAMGGSKGDRNGYAGRDGSGAGTGNGGRDIGTRTGGLVNKKATPQLRGPDVEYDRSGQINERSGTAGSSSGQNRSLGPYAGGTGSPPMSALGNENSMQGNYNAKIGNRNRYSGNYNGDTDNRSFWDRAGAFLGGLGDAGWNTDDPAVNTYGEALNQFNPVTGVGMRFTNAMYAAGFQGSISDDNAVQGPDAAGRNTDSQEPKAAADLFTSAAGDPIEDDNQNYSDVRLRDHRAPYQVFTDDSGGTGVIGNAAQALEDFKRRQSLVTPTARYVPRKRLIPLV